MCLIQRVTVLMAKSYGGSYIILSVVKIAQYFNLPTKTCIAFYAYVLANCQVKGEAAENRN